MEQLCGRKSFGVGEGREGQASIGREKNRQQKKREQERETEGSN